jgi:hypothetical protein
MPDVSGLLGQLGGLIPGSTSLTPATQGAINDLTATGQAGNPYAAGTTGAINGMLSGGNATAEAPIVNAAYSTLQGNLAPYTSPNYSTVNSPQMQAALSTIQNDTTNNVNGQFAASGRAGSAANSMALGRGIAAAEAPLLLNQANTDTATRLAASNALYGAGNTTATTLAGMNQQGINNQNTGLSNIAPALQNSTWGPQTAITAQELAQSIPASNLGLLANIGIPLANLGSTASGTSNTTKSPGMLDQIGTGLTDATKLLALL